MVLFGTPSATLAPSVSISSALRFIYLIGVRAAPTLFVRSTHRCGLSQGEEARRCVTVDEFLTCVDILITIARQLLDYTRYTTIVLDSPKNRVEIGQAGPGNCGMIDC